MGDSTGTGSPSVICKEVFDDGYQPSMEEINEYASKIGIDPEKEPHLLFLAKEGLMQALPKDWKICYNDKLNAHYYYNTRTKVTQWDHPLDAIYRDLIDKERQRLSSITPETTTNIKISNSQVDISEDVSQLDSGIRSLQGNEELEASITTVPTKTVPTSTKNAPDLSEIANISNKISPSICKKVNPSITSRFIVSPVKLTPLNPIKMSRFEIVKTNPQIGLDMRFNSDPVEPDENRKPVLDMNIKKGFTISGTGAMFLKSNTKRANIFEVFNAPLNTDKSKIESNIAPMGAGVDVGLKGNTTTRSDSYKDNKSNRNIFFEPLGYSVKGILRDSSLTDVRRKQHLDDVDGIEDKKSVRFNLDDIKMRSNYSPEEDASSSRKFGPSPEVSENSDDENEDDDPWDFMEEDEGEHGTVFPNQEEILEQEDEPQDEKHVKEIKVLPTGKNFKIPKPPLKSSSNEEVIGQLSLAGDVARNQFLRNSKLISLERKFSLESTSAGGTSGSSLLEKLKEQNMVRPLYEDTDSESRGSSIQKYDDDDEGEIYSTNPFVNTLSPKKVDTLRKEHEQKMQNLRNKFQKELENEEKRLREELSMQLEEKRREILEEHTKQLECKNNKNTKFENESKVIATDRMKIDNEIEKELDTYRKEKESQKKQRLQSESEKFEQVLQAEIEELQREYKQKILDAQHEYNVKMDTTKKKMEEEHINKLAEYRNALEKDYEERRNNVIDEQKARMDTLQKNHAEILQELDRDLKSEEEILKKEHANKLTEMRNKLTHELEMEKQRMRESGEDRLYEKIRCEKRLIEDKYRCLKEKYIRLKTDVKLSLERRNRRREQQAGLQQSLGTTGSETERSVSNKPSIGNSENRSVSLSTSVTAGAGDNGKPPLTPKSNHHHQQYAAIKDSFNNIGKEKVSSAERRDRKVGITSKYIKQLQAHYQEDTTSISQSDTTISNNYPRGRYLSTSAATGAAVGNLSDNGNSDSESFQIGHHHRNYNQHHHNHQENNNNPREKQQRKKFFTKMKSASTSRLNTENYKIDRPCTPVENLRRQLQKLEDLEDQFPDNTLDTTYHLRYPFSDISNDHTGGASSAELEFFKHRIHLERDSVRRAKESLRTQRTNFRARQREIKQRHKMPTSRHTIEQLIQEERELTEMEVNLHRTRALLGEKVIRLRHLEQSLQRLYEKEKPMDFLQIIENKDDATLSDLSSHSSSGFSSTDFASDTHQANINRKKEMYQESSECIQNLEILNAEIREILDILSKQQTHGLAISPDINWPPLLSTGIITSTGNANITAPPLSTPNFTNIIAGKNEVAIGGGVDTDNPMTPTSLHAPQSIPTLADRLENYRQLAAGRMQSTVGGAFLTANTIVSQSPRAVNYTTSLVERTRDLRNWLRQAKNEHEILSRALFGTTMNSQATTTTTTATATVAANNVGSVCGNQTNL